MHSMLKFSDQAYFERDHVRTWAIACGFQGSKGGIWDCSKGQQLGQVMKQAAQELVLSLFSIIHGLP